MSATVEIKGLDRLIKKYKKLKKNFSPGLKKVTLEAATYAHSQIPPYPAPPPSSSYRRTGTLGRTIKAKVREESDQTWAGVLGTPTVYAPWVISEDRGINGAGGQAFMHKGRWWTLQGVVRKSKNKIVGIYKSGIKRLIKEADNGI